MGSQANEGPLHPGGGWRRVQEGDSVGDFQPVMSPGEIIGLLRPDSCIWEEDWAGGMYMGIISTQHCVIFKANGFNRVIWEGV